MTISIDMGVLLIQGVDMRLRNALGLMCFLAILGCDEDDNSVNDVVVTPSKGENPALSVECSACQNSEFKLNEGSGKLTIQVGLTTEPTNDVKIEAKASDDTEIAIAPADATIAAADWKDKKVSFEISGLEDNVADGDQTVSVVFHAKSDDANYANLDPVAISGTVVDSGNGGKPCTVVCIDDKTLSTCPNGKAGEAVKQTCEYGCSNDKCNDAPQAKCTQSSCKDAMTLNVCDTATGLYTPKNCEYGCAANRCKSQDDKSVVIRFMAANITSGKYQTYDDQRGIHIIKAFNPDIILMQEFNYEQGQHALVKEICGDNCHFSTTSHSIPNAIISKYPILSSGSWPSNVKSARNWDWAVINIPGKRKLLAVSLHLHSERNGSELAPLKQKIEAKQKEGNYYVVIGGDFNTKSRGGVRSQFGRMLYVGKDNPNAKDDKTAVPALDKVCDGGEFPVDQNGNSCTSGERDDPYDWVLFDKDLNEFEIPIVVGNRTYNYGHIVDSRIYAQHDELSLIPPVQAEDSELCYADDWCTNNKGERTNMQHQAVVRDIELQYE